MSDRITIGQVNPAMLARAKTQAERDCLLKTGKLHGCAPKPKPAARSSFFYPSQPRQPQYVEEEIIEEVIPGEQQYAWETYEVPRDPRDGGAMQRPQRRRFGGKRLGGRHLDGPHSPRGRRGPRKLDQRRSLDGAMQRPSRSANQPKKLKQRRSMDGAMQRPTRGGDAAMQRPTRGGGAMQRPARKPGKPKKIKRLQRRGKRLRKKRRKARKRRKSRQKRKGLRRQWRGWKKEHRKPLFRAGAITPEELEYLVTEGLEDGTLPETYVDGVIGGLDVDDEGYIAADAEDEEAVGFLKRLFRKKSKRQSKNTSERKGLFKGKMFQKLGEKIKDSGGVGEGLVKLFRKPWVTQELAPAVELRVKRGYPVKVTNVGTAEEPAWKLDPVEEDASGALIPLAVKAGSGVAKMIKLRKRLKEGPFKTAIKPGESIIVQGFDGNDNMVIEEDAEYAMDYDDPTDEAGAVFIDSDGYQVHL